MQADDFFALAGRILLAVVFLAAAFGKITNFEATTKYMETHGLFWTPLLCSAAIVIEAMGGISLILGFHARRGSAVLAGFLIVVTFVFHMEADQRIHLLKNLAIIGGLLQVVAFGPGNMSLDGRGP